MPNLMFLRILPFIGALICMLLAIVFAAMVGKTEALPGWLRFPMLFLLAAGLILTSRQESWQFFHCPGNTFRDNGYLRISSVAVVACICNWHGFQSADRLYWNVDIHYLQFPRYLCCPEKGLGEAMNIAFTAAAASGLLLGTVALFDTAFWFNILYWFYNRSIPDPALAMENVVNILITFTIGASFAAFFMRTGGGIFTKAADMGADYVGKVESDLQKMITETRRQLLIMSATNVGDVGGMKADSLESWVGQ